MCVCACLLHATQSLSQVMNIDAVTHRIYSGSPAHSALILLYVANSILMFIVYLEYKLI